MEIALNATVLETFKHLISEQTDFVKKKNEFTFPKNVCVHKHIGRFFVSSISSQGRHDVT